MAKPIGTVFVELDLDATKYTKGQKEILAGAKSTSLDVEKNWKILGQKSDLIYDAMRKQAENAFEMIKNRAASSAQEIARAEQAKAAKIASINEQQYGKQVGMIEKLKGNWMAAAAAITAAYIGISKAWNLAEQAAQFEQSKEAFRGMARSMGADAESVFTRVRKLSGGLIDDASIVQSMNKALSLGIPIEKLGDLMLVARAKSRDMGITTTQAFNDIATGIGRGSPLILDNLGLMLKLGSANEAMASSLNKTVEQLSDKEKKTAILNATLEAGKEALSRYNLEVLTTKERMDALVVQFENVKHTIGDVILRLGAGLVGTFQTVSAAATGLAALIMAPISALAAATDYLGVTKDKAEEYRRSIEAMTASAQDLAEKAGANFALMQGGLAGGGSSGGYRRSTAAEPPSASAADKEAKGSLLKILAERADALQAFYGDAAELSKIAADDEIKAFEARAKAREKMEADSYKARFDMAKDFEDSLRKSQEEESTITEPVKGYGFEDAMSASEAYGNVSLAVQTMNSELGRTQAVLMENQSMIDIYKTAWVDANLAVTDSIASLYSGMQDWISSSIQGLVEGTKGVMDVLKGLGSMMLSIITQYIAKWITSRLFMAATEKTLAATAMALEKVQTLAFVGSKIAQATASTGAGAARALSEYSWPYSAVVAAAVMAEGAAIIAGMTAGSAVAGAAHGGLEYVPSEATYLLDKGERVISPKQNKDLTNFIRENDGDGDGTLTVNVMMDREVLFRAVRKGVRTGELDLVLA